ncbi:retention module-containing protein [Buttiauxella sp. A111]|uniref:retention module-containing protein n=1 Tax=Buttiauxella sp. A111 TaxID=2563088 RepID=UPI0016165A49|nr:retention module-containing protein [Buttiauxella sp. A111]
MSNLLGVIRAVIGQVYVIEADGSQRLLKEGDRIYSGEEIVTGSSGAVSVSLPDGKTLDLGRNSHWTEHGLTAVNSTEHDAQDVASLQKAIADGADPTQSLEATAAGNETPAPIVGGGGGHTHVQLELTGEIIDPTAGFKTQGLGAPTWTHELPEGARTAGSPPVLPPLVQIDDFAGNDGFINKNEINHATINGTSNQNHVTLTFTDSQKNTLTIEVDVQNGHWTTQPDLSGLAEGEITVIATATDVSGRTAVSTAEAQIDTIALHDNITIDNVTADNVINIAESHHAQTSVHGTVSGDARIGDKITLTVNGHEYTDLVIDLGNGVLGYRIDVSTQGLLADPNIHATVTSTDEAGNTIQVSSDHHVEIDLDVHNTLSIQTVAGDDIVNTAESRMPTMITGVVGGDAHEGDPVTVTVGGRDFHGVVVNDNGQLHYEVPVPTHLLKEGANDVQVQLVSHDAAGNEAIAIEHKTITLDTQAHNALTIDTVATDNVVNAAESRMPTLISGEITGDAQVGDHVVVSVNGQSFYGAVTVDENGHLRYEVPVPTDALTEGSNDVQVMVTGVDDAGNTAIAVEHKTVVLDTQAHNALTIDTVATDNVVNAAESRMPTLISGEVTGDAQVGDHVVVSVNGQSFYGAVTVDENGHLRYEVPVPTDALLEGSNDVQVMVTGVDDAGNTAIAVEHKTIVLDTQAHNALTIDTVAGDNTVNAHESRMPTLISGAVTGDAQAGDRVVVSVNGQSFYGEVTVDENGHLRYEVPVPTNALSEGSNDVQVMVTGVDDAGNTAIAVEHKTVVLDTQAHNALTIDKVAGDNTVNTAESSMPTLISGEVTGDAQVGDKVVVSVNGKEFYGAVTVDEHGHLRYEVPVPTDALSEGSNDVQVMVTGVDDAGNTAIAVEHKTVVLDTQAHNALTIDTVATDNVVNAAESRMPTLISGEVTGDAQVGDHVVVSVNGKEFYGAVTVDENGHLRYEVPVPTDALSEGSNDVQVMVTGVDDAGNTAIAVEHKTVVLDTQAHNALTIDTVAGDNTVNAAESRMPTLISGEVTGDAQVGDHVVVSVNGKEFYGEVTADDNGHLRYEVPVPTNALNEGSNDVQVMVTGVDDAGNTAIAVEHKTVVLDTQAHNALTIDTVAGDNTVNTAESRMPTLISGEITGDAQVGDRVVVSVNGKEFYGAVTVDENGHLRYEVPVPTDALSEGSNDVQVMVTGVDDAGNTAIAVEHKTIVLDTQAHNALTIDTVAGDNTVNMTESRMPTFISGEVTGDAQVGDHVVVSVNGKEFYGAVTVDESGHLRYEVPVPTNALNEGSNDVQVMVTGVDDAGNTAIAIEHKTVTLDTQAKATISINSVTDDNVLNHTELGKAHQLISGVVDGDARKGDVVELDINGHKYTGNVIELSDGTLGYQIPVDSSAFSNNQGEIDTDVKFTARVTSHDKAGNEVIQTTEHTVHIDNHANNGMTINTVAGDNVVNKTESEGPTHITGIVNGPDSKAGDLVVVRVDGHDFKGEVFADARGRLHYDVAVHTDLFNEGRNDVQVTVTSHDGVGNEAVTTEHKTVTLDTHAKATIAIDDVTKDNVLNHTELDKAHQLISGVVDGDARKGDVVELDINGHKYSGEVIELADGKLGYQIPVDSSAFSNNQGEIDGNVTFTASVTAYDKAGNEVIQTTEHTVHIDNHANNGVTIHTVAGDNVVNKTESEGPTHITGIVNGPDAKAGDHVVVRVDGHDFKGEVFADARGRLHYDVAVHSDLLHEGKNDVQVTVTSHDRVGNEAIATEHKNVTLDTQAKATLSIDSVTDDNVLNHTELGKAHQMISGVVDGDARKGDVVELDINGHKYTGNVIELSDGTLGYQIPVDSSAFSNNQGEIDTDVKFTARVTSHDKAGNEVIQTTEDTVHIDNHANNGMTINTVAGDNVVNKTESEGPTHITGIVNGPDAKAGDLVVVRVDGHDFKGEVFADARGRLHYDVAVHSDLLHEGKNDVQVTVTSHDGVGNEAVATEHKTVTLDTQAKATITIDSVTDDNVLNHTELDKAHQMISGVVDGDARKGDVVELDINGHKYTGNVIELSDGTQGYQIPVDSSAFSNNQGEIDTDVKFTASVTAHDKAGNEVTQTTEHTVHIDNHANNGVTIHTVAGDNIVSFKESLHDTLITGDVTGPDAKAGDVVEVRLDGHVQPFFGKVSYENGHLVYKVAVPSGALKEGANNVTVTVTSHDKVGNEAIATEHHNVTLDTHADASITVDRVTKDNTLSHAEMAEQKHMITGTVGGDAHKGDVVILDFNGNKYTGHVIEMGDGTLGYKIPVDSSAFGDNNTKIDGDVKFTASVTSHDAVNNEVTVTTEHTVHVDNFAVTGLTMNTVSGDGYVNAKESAQDTLITGGVSGDAKEGDPVVVTVNNQTFTGVVVNNHGHLRYEVPVPTSALHEGKNDVVVTLTSHDALGNEAIATAHKNVTLDTHADATITLNGVTEDNILNHDELAQPKQTITGTVDGDAKVGDIVTLEINGHTYSDTVVDLDGKGHLGYRIDVDSSAFGQNSEGEIDRDVKFTASVTSHDAAHNEVTVTTDHTVHIDNHANNAITINTVAGDNWVNAAESNSATFISGDVSGIDAKDGDPVVVNVWGHNYHGKVVADAYGNLHYEVAIPRGVLHEGDNAVTVTVTSNDAAHNVAHAVLTHNVSVDTHADATISIDSITDDNILNHDELATPMRLVSGVVGGDAKLGDSVNLEINGHHFSGNVIDLGHGQLGYQIPVDSSAFSDNQGKIDTDVKFIASVTSTDHLNNVVTVTTEHTVHIDNHAEAGITMDIVSGDNTINQLEAKQHTTKVSGTVSGDDVHAGDKIIVTVNGHNYETTVEPQPHLNGALGYSLNILTKDVLADQNITAHVVGHDSVGNQQLAEVTTTMTVDREAVATITIDPVTANHDNMINGKESQSEFTDVTGSVGGDAKEGDLVTLHINGIDYTGRVDASHQYSISVSTHDLMVDPHITASVTVTDQANNMATAHATQDIIVDTQAIAHISVDSVTDDNTLDGEELNHRYSLVTGKVSGEMQAGDPLTLNINGHEYHGTVETLPDGKLGYEILVETRDIHTDPTIIASISVTDAAGNSVTATDHHQVNIDDHADASLTINIVSGDDILNQHDQESDTTTINGRVGGDVKIGDVVDVTVDGKVYSVKVELQKFGLGYSIDVPTKDLLHDPHIVATVSTSDAAGNTITAGATHDVSRDDHADATITIDPVTDDNTINNAEAHKDHTTITGNVTGDVHTGDQVDLTVNGQHYYGYVSDKGTYTIDVSTADLISGGDKPDIHASVMGADAAGNTLLAEFDRVVNIDTRADAEIKIGSLALNSSRDFWVIEGTVGGDAKEGDVVKIFAGGKTYETTVQRYPDGHLGFKGDHLTDPVTGRQVYIGPYDLDNNADVKVQITSTDPYGNTETATAQVQAHVTGGSNNNGTDHNGGTTTPHYSDPHATITINTVAGDNTINQTESQSPTTVVRGTVSGDVKEGDHVTVHVGGKDYDCIVSELPNLPGELGYEANVDTKDLMANPNITASVTAHNGGTVTHVFDAQAKVQVDTDVSATIQLDKIAGDNTINIAEAKNGTTTISGTVTGDGVHDGSNVTLMVNGHKITTQVHKDPATGVMTFSKDVSIDDLRQNPQVTASVDGHDKQGNVITVSNDVTVTVDTDVSAHVTIDNVTSDNVLNLNETRSVNTDITGTVSGDVEQGDHVTITVNNHKYDAVVDGSNNYKVSVLTSDLAQGKTITAEVTGHDAAQNSITVTETHGLSVDTVAEGSITINTVSGDNILSANDLSAKTTEISGVVGKDARIGDEVTITLNGHTTVVTVGELPNMNGQLGYTMQVNTADLKAELDAELTAHPNEQPHITVTVSGKDDAGNDFSQSASRPVAIDDHADVALNINNVTDDNVLNNDESKQALTEISGTVSGDVHVGNNVIVHVNGNDLIVPIEKDASGNLTFSVKVPTSDLLQNQIITYTVTGTDAVGNTVIVSEKNTITVDQTASNSIHIDTVAGDDKVNIKEFGQPTTHVTGTVTGDAHDGDPVTLTVNGNTFTGVVADHDGKLTYDIAVDNSALKEGPNSVEVSVTGKDAAGNTATSTDTHNITLDTNIDGSITLDPVAGDNVINTKESAHVSVTGTVDGDAQRGDIVTLNVNGHTIQTKVVPVGDHLGYDVKVVKGWLHEGYNDVEVSVRIRDNAGNKLIATHKQDVVLDTHADASITVNAITADNTINAHESAHISVTGTVNGDAKEGDAVTLEINGHAVTTTVKDLGDHLGYDVEIKKAWLHEGHNDVNASVDVTDKAGNHFTATQTHPVFVDTLIDASITINPLATQNVVNAKDPEHITVSGQVGQDVKLGEHVTLQVNHHTFTTEVKMINGHLGYEAQMDKSWLSEGDNELKVRVTTEDHAGNTRSAYSHQTIQLDTQADATLTVNKVAGDNHINAHEAHHELTHITGQVEGDVQKGAHITATFGGKHYEAILHETDGHLTYDIPVNTADFHPGDNKVTVSIAAHDEHGNTGSASQEVNVTLDAASRHGKESHELADKPHHAAHAAAHDNGLSNLFDDSHESLTFELHHPEKDHHSSDDHQVFTGKASDHHGKIDLSDLAHELHEGTDITQLIKGGDAHGGKGDAVHSIHTGGDPAPLVTHDAHGSSSYTLDHLLAKPEHYSH